MISLRPVKTQLIIFLFAFALFWAVRQRSLSFLAVLAIATSSAFLFELAFSWVQYKKIVLSSSAIISGLIIGYVLASDQAWWLFTSAAVFAITAKHLVRSNGKHLFNPAAVGIFLTVSLFHAQTQWNGTYLWYILAPAGIYFARIINKREVLLGYGVVSLLLFGTEAVLQGVPLVRIGGYLSYFFIFIMLIEPKTSAVTSLGKLFFGVGVAVLIFCFTHAGVRFGVELGSLMLMNVSVPFLNRIRF